jgi:hypothetical protein
MTNNLLKKAAQRIIQEQTIEQIELGELPFHLALYPKGNEVIVEVRKRWKIRLDQPITPTAIYVKKLLNAVFSGKPVTAQIKIECSDEFQTKAKLKSVKLL